MATCKCYILYFGLPVVGFLSCVAFRRHAHSHPYRSLSQCQTIPCRLVTFCRYVYYLVISLIPASSLVQLKLSLGYYFLLTFLEYERIIKHAFLGQSGHNGK